MDGDFDFLGGPFPRSSSPTPVMNPGDTTATIGTATTSDTIMSLGRPQPQPQYPPPAAFALDPGVRILGGPSIADANLDDPLPQPYNYDAYMQMNMSSPPPSLSQFPSPPVGVSMLPAAKKRIGGEHYLGMNCIDIANHLAACPVCSKLHKSHANIYIGVIIFLIIVIFFLGRKFFD